MKRRVTYPPIEFVDSLPKPSNLAKAIAWFQESLTLPAVICRACGKPAEISKATRVEYQYHSKCSPHYKAQHLEQEQKRQDFFSESAERKKQERVERKVAGLAPIKRRRNNTKVLRRRR